MLQGHLQCVTPSSSRLLSKEQAKLHCRCQNNLEDDSFLDWIKSAEAFAQDHTGVALLTSTWRLTLCEFPDDDVPIDLQISPVQSIVSVTYTDSDGDEVVLDAEDYQLDANVLVPKLWPGVDFSWPSTEAGNVSAVVIDFLAGHTSADLVPAQFNQAMKLIIGEWYVNRDVTEIPAAALRLLDQVKAVRYV